MALCDHIAASLAVCCRSRHRTCDLRVRPDALAFTELYGIPFYIHQRDHATQPLNIRVRLSVSLFLAFFREVIVLFNPCLKMLAPLQILVASYLVSKTTLTSFGVESSIVSLSNAYPALRWIFFSCPNCQRTISFHLLRKEGDSNSRVRAY